MNISYGSFYLRYLLRRYGGNEVLAIAAYNAQVSEALKAAGYPASADKGLVNSAMVIALLFFTQLCTAIATHLCNEA